MPRPSSGDFQLVLLKEIRSKEKKNIFSKVFAPGIPNNLLKKKIQFISNSEDGINSFLYDPEQRLQFFLYEGKYLPSIQFIRSNPSIKIPKVKVDQGAVPYILNGADIYTQGIVSILEEFNENEIVIIVNPQDSILALGKAILNSTELLTSRIKGILNIHYLGDRIWNVKNDS